MTDQSFIDVHQHVVPPAYARWLAGHGWHLPVPSWSADTALAAMDGQRVEAALLSVTTPGLYRADQRAARDLAREVNEFAAGQVARHPGRFGFFATVTLPDVTGAVAEACYALDHLGADGVVLMANANGRYLGDQQFAPLYAELDQRAATLFIHPVFPAYLGPPPATGIPASDVDLLAQTTHSAVDLVSSGLLTRYGRMRVLLAHAGGYLPYMSHRIAPMCSADGSYASGLAILRRFYFDVALSASTITLATLMAFAAPGHVMFGTDWPYATPAVLEHFAAEFAAFGFAPGQAESVARGAARELFPRLARS